MKDRNEDADVVVNVAVSTSGVDCWRGRAGQRKKKDEEDFNRTCGEGDSLKARG